MREIKFRAWNRETKLMWWFNPTWGNTYNRGSGWVGMLPIGETLQHIGGFTGHDNRVMVDPDNCELMQYTGLHDKNGKEIYEGDIVVVKHFDEYDNIRVQGVVVWGAGEWCLEDGDKEFIQIWDDGEHKWYGFAKLCPEFNSEVIGNIYEKHELLKEGNNG